MWIFSYMPKPAVQVMLVALLVAVVALSVLTVALAIWRPEGGRLVAPARWAGTVAGLAVCAAFYQFITTRWFAAVMEHFDDVEAYPSGPPSHITRSIIDNPDAPVQSAIRNFLFYDPSLAAVLGLWAGVFTIASYWID